jgi:pimeloyl-ACP methyl ester carboxylesterase
MEILLFLPGIFGSKLALGDEEVWPPKVGEVLTGYKRVDKLLSPDLQVTGVVKSACIDIYGSILDALEDAGYEADGDRRLAPHPYDWRRDLLKLADDLDARLSGLAAEHGPGVEIKLVCHSMGGLVARACLEKPRAAAPDWADAVKLCVFLATPHNGAPLAFARAIGAGGGSMGLSEKQLIKLSSAPAFPSGYQLFSTEDLTPIWRLDGGGPPFEGVSLFDPDTAANYPLNPANLAAAKALFARLDIARRPPGCRYFSIVSAAHETVTRFDEEGGRAEAVKVRESGDGTVPVQSAAVLRIQTAYVVANHLGVAQNDTTHRLLRMLLGVEEPDAVAAAVQPGLAPELSLSARVVAEDEGYEIVVAAGADGIDGAIVIEREGRAGAFRQVRKLRAQVKAEGARRLSLEGPELRPGRYRFRLVSEGASTGEEDLVVMKRNQDP